VVTAGSPTLTEVFEPHRIEIWNEDPRPFVWTKTAEEILNSLAEYIAKISGAGH
jgi:hypothetical protein